MRILLAWELGGNYGHLSILLNIARHLRLRGHRVLFAVKNHLSSRKLLDAEGFRYILAPRSVNRKNSFRRPDSFADILSGAGFGNVEVLDSLIQSWQEMFRNVQPDVAVSQYAPVAQFAARLSGVACLSVSTGFEHPPDTAPFPCFRTNRQTTREQLLARESEVLDKVNRVLSRHGHCSCSSLQEIIKSDLDLLATLPELDHYRRRRNGCYIGPLSMLDHGLTIPWRQRKGLRVFVYLWPFPHMRLFLDILAASGAEVIAHIPEIEDKVAANYVDTSVRITTSMVKLSGLLAEMDLAITHAGHGTACTMLLAGVPLMMIPTTVEQWLTSRNIEDLGCGIGIEKKSGAKTFRAVLEKLVADGSAYRLRAQKVAEQYATYSTKRQMTRIGKTVEGLPAWAAGSRSRLCLAK